MLINSFGWGLLISASICAATVLVSYIGSLIGGESYRKDFISNQKLNLYGRYTVWAIIVLTLVTFNPGLLNGIGPDVENMQYTEKLALFGGLAFTFPALYIAHKILCKIYI